MNNEEGSVDPIDVLRDEILAEQVSGNEEEPILPGGILSLLAEAGTSVEVGHAIDDLLVEEDTISGPLYARLVARVSSEVERRATTSRFLEQVLRAGREQKEFTPEQLADRLSITADRIRGIETAKVAVGSLEEKQIAEWIDELDLPLEIAMRALETSLLQPASVYRGEEQRRTRQDVSDFVSSVRRLVEERRARRD